jgi:hypothetical protein
VEFTWQKWHSEFVAPAPRWGILFCNKMLLLTHYMCVCVVVGVDSAEIICRVRDSSFQMGISCHYFTTLLISFFSISGRSEWSGLNKRRKFISWRPNFAAWQLYQNEDKSETNCTVYPSHFSFRRQEFNAILLAPKRHPRKNENEFGRTGVFLTSFYELEATWLVRARESRRRVTRSARRRSARSNRGMSLGDLTSQQAPVARRVRTGAVGRHPFVAGRAGSPNVSPSRFRNPNRFPPPANQPKHRPFGFFPQPGRGGGAYGKVMSVIELVNRNFISFAIWSVLLLLLTDRVLRARSFNTNLMIP